MPDLSMPFARRERKPCVAVQPDGQVAVYIGSAYQYLPLRHALHLRRELDRAIDQAMNFTEACHEHV